MSEIAFSGFPEECLQFFADLKTNNNRGWFQRHKQDYIDFVQTPAKEFVIVLGEWLKTLSGGMIYDTRMSGVGSVLRVYRDIRFSKDKSPYNTRLRIIFWEGPGKKMETPGVFFGLDERGARLHVGMHKFPKRVLAAYREAVVDPTLGTELTEVFAGLKMADNYELGGMHYKRVPRGYDPAHQRVEFLKYNGLYASSPLIDPSVVITPALLEVCFEYCHKMAPLHQWLVKVQQIATETP